MTTIKPGTSVPALEVETLGGGAWKLADGKPENFTMVVFYRGLHCPICKGYLRDLDRKLGEFGELGVDVIAISGDDKARAEKTKAEWGIENLTIGYGQGADNMRAWGLYISKGIKDPEPPQFAEPGLFIVRPNGELFYAGVNSMPFGRPSFTEMLQAVKFVLDKNYPARGEA